MISQVRSVLHSTTCFTRQYCMLVCSFYCFLKTSSFHSLTKVCPVQTFPHNQITLDLWLCVLECGNRHLNLFWMLGKLRQVWQVCVCAIARVTAHAQIKEDCCYLAESVFRHCKEGSWHQELKTTGLQQRAAQRTLKHVRVCAADKTDVDILHPAVLWQHPAHA